MASLIAFFNLTPVEIMIILAVGVLLFGRKLPDVGRYLGKSITEFKKGYKGLEDEMDLGGSTNLQRPEQPQAMEQIRPPQRLTPSAPKFEDHTPVTTPPQV